MLRLVKTLALLSALVALPATAVGSSPSTVPGTWRKLAPEPVALPYGGYVWTGRQLIVIGRKQVPKPVDIAESYDPVSNSWTRLSPPPGPGYVPGYATVWTGKEMLAFDSFHSVAYNPRTNVWRTLRKSVSLGLVAWTGREAIGWGGGCCGDAQSTGSAYNPATGVYRTLPRSPLAPSQGPLGAWTGRELILFVSGLSPDGKPYPARFARAAAYDPKTNTWRRLAPFPASGVRMGTGAWDGRELLVVGAGATSRSAYAYNPGANRWRPLASLPATHVGGTALWTGSRLIFWGGQNATGTKSLNDGLAYDPKTDRWSAIARAPLRTGGSAVAWTGRSLLVCGGVIGSSKATHYRQIWLREGAAFTPAGR